MCDWAVHAAHVRNQTSGVRHGGHFDHRFAAVHKFDQHVGAEPAASSLFGPGLVGGFGMVVERIVLSLARRDNGEAQSVGEIVQFFASSRLIASNLWAVSTK